MTNNKCCSRLCVAGLGLAIGIVSGLCMMAFAWIAWMFGYGVMMVDQMAAVYHGYAATFKGGFWGLMWGFVDGFIWGILVALFYNFFAKCCGKMYCKSSESCK